MIRREVVHGSITVISRWIFNCYVVHDAGTGTALVVDPGTPANGRDAASEVHRLHGGAAASVVCTHGHADHVAGVDAVCDAGSGYHLPRPCEAWLAGGVDIQAPGFREFVKIAPVAASQPFEVAPLRELAPLSTKVGTQSDRMLMPFAPAGFLDDGDVVPRTQGWEVIASPGHTADSTCFYHRETATLLSGDSVLTHDGQAWFNPEHLLAAESADTEERLRSLPVEHLLPGHGRPISGTDLLRSARSFRAQPPPTSLSCRLARLLGDWGR